MSEDHPVVLFDGECGLCDRSVRFICEQDRGDHFRFAPLQSELGQSLLRAHGLPADVYKSLVLIDAEGVHLRSTGALRIARKLRAPWCWLACLLWLPSILRDPVYNLVARYRHRFFPPKETCGLPSPELRRRLLG